MDISETEIKEINNNNLEYLIKTYKYTYFGSIIKYYESIVKYFGSIIKVKPGKNKEKEFQRINSELLLDVNINQIDSTSIFFLIIFIIVGIFSGLLINPLYFLIFFILGILFYVLLDYYYIILYNGLKARKKGQLVSLLLLISVKLRQNPNLEQALVFSIRNINLPLKIDLLRLLRDIYNRKYISASEGILDYSRMWEKDAKFFYLGIMLLESALYDPDKEHRAFQIDRAMEEALEELLSELNFFARDIRSSINLVSMLGITLPVMLLTIFPLASIFLSNLISPLDLFILFDILVPFLAFYVLNYSVSSRLVTIFNNENLYSQYINERDIKNKLISFGLGAALFIFLFFIIVLVAFRYPGNFDISGIVFSELFVLLLGISISFGSYVFFNNFRDLYFNLKKIDSDLPAFLLSLSNSLNQGYPIEKSLLYIYPRFNKSPLGTFLSKLYQNLRSGMPLKDSIFDPKKGVLKDFPSQNLKASIEIIFESSSVSPEEAAAVTAIISKYFLLLDKVRERIKDLVAEDLSQLKSLLRFIAPAILGIVSAVTILTIEILYRLSFQLQQIAKLSGGTSQYSSYINSLPSLVLNLFNLNGLITPPIIIIIVGLFNTLISLVIIYAINSIEESGDKLSLYYNLYRYSLVSNLLFFIFSTLSTVFMYLFISSILNVSTLF